MSRGLDSARRSWDHVRTMRTTVNISDDIVRDLREQSALSGRSFREVMEESLALGLARLPKPARRQEFRVQPHPLGLKAEFQEMSLNQLYDQVEAEEAARQT